MEKNYYIFEDVLTEHLFRHCALELSSASHSILESHGYSDYVSGIIQKLYKRINHDIGSMKINTNKTFIYDDMSLFSGTDVFFTGFKIIISVDYNEKYKTDESSGGYNDKGFLEYDGDIVKFCPDIIVYAKGSNNLGIRKVIGKTLGHEFTHAYNDYEMFINSKGKKRLGTSFLKGYSDMASNSPNPIENNIDKIIYFTDRSERNAHVAQLNQELERHKEPMFTELTFTDAIRSTETYKKLLDVIDALNILQNLASSDTSGKNRNDIIKVVNSLTGRKFRRFRSAFDFLRDRVVRSKMKIEEQAPKIAYDIYRKRKFKF